ncbi:beta-propeller domain-containing protein [Sphingopyxis sp. LARHCG72]
MDGFTRIWAYGQWALVAGLLAAPLWVGASPGSSQQFAATTQGSGQMRAFAGEAEFRAFLAKRLKRAQEEARKAGNVVYDLSEPAALEVAAAGADAAAAPEEPAARAAPEGDGITNVQTAGVDEGGIVKKQGDLLIVLRRGRLFTIDAAGGGMRPVAAVDVFPGQSDPEGTWYDEMLVSGDTVVVLGYSYARNGTEVNRFRLSDDGKLEWRDTHYLRSGDYYSSRNYASRLIGDKLIFYAPLYLEADPGNSLPALAAWEKGKVGRFKPFATAEEIYMPEPAWHDDRLSGEILHSVMICDLGGDGMDCDANNVLGGWARNFYVSQDAVYVWTGFGPEWGESADDNRAMLYRIPLDGKAPQAVEVAGMPLDQFSFREEKDGSLHVLTMAAGGGDAMWQAEANDKGDMALLHLAATRFGNGAEKVDAKDYRALPGVESWERQNRFVGDWLLYAGGQGHRDLRKEDAKTAPLYAVPLNGGAVVPLDPGHGVGRIDIMGRDAIVVGSGEGNALVFSTVALGARPALASRFRFPAAGEGENRSHAFFYRPDPGSDGDDGLLGLPVMRERDGGTRYLGSAASILYLRRDQRDLSLAGTLDARPGKGEDHCLASCVDWYGNARPVFFGGRIFALMGYELVEGRWQAGTVRESARIDFTPRRRTGR